MRLRLALLALVVGVVAVPGVAQATPPDNDDYLSPRITNTPGTAFPNGGVAQHTIPGGDPTGTIDEATEQPTGMGDTSDTNEDLACETPVAPMVKTVWYWTFPHVSGWLQVRTTGGDAVIRLITVNSGGGLGGNNTPNFADSACADDPNDTSAEELFVGVIGGLNRRYAIQVGVYDDDPTFGVWGAGQHLTRITFFHDRDLDQVFDTNDRCPTQVGSPNRQGCPDGDGDGVINPDDRCPSTFGPASLRGCPDGDGDGIPNVDDRCAGENSQARDANRNGCLDLRKFSGKAADLDNRTYFSRSRGRFVRNGVTMDNLTVSGLPSGTRVQLTCSRRVCKRTVKRGRRVNFRKQLRGRRLRPGKTVTVTVSKSGYVTRRYRFKARKKGKRGVSESNRCVVPGTRTLRSCSRVSVIR